MDKNSLSTFEPNVALYQNILDALQHNDLLSIATTAWRYYKQPILIVDDNYKLLSLFPNEQIGDPIWDEIVLLKSLSREKSYEYYASIREPLLNIRDPSPDAEGVKNIFWRTYLHNTGLARDCPRLICRIPLDDHREAIIAVFMQSKEISPMDYTVLELFAKAVSIQMTSRNYGMPLISDYLRDLLEEKSTVNKSASEIIQTRLAGNYVVISAKTASQYEMSYLANALVPLTHTYKNIIATTLDNCAVILFGNISGKKIKINELYDIKQLCNHLTDYKAVCGISDVFTNILEVKIHFDQAQLTTQVGKTQINFYSDYFPRQIYAALRNHYDPLTFTGGEFLEEILKTDAEEKTEYYKTLRQYCLCLCNKDKTCNLLHIHRNTLLYRLRKIEQLFSIYLNDEEYILQLIICFLLQENLS